MKKVFILMTGMWLLSGCANWMETKNNPHSLITAAPQHPEIVIPEGVPARPQFNEQTIFNLAEEQISQFSDWYYAPENAHIEAHERVYQYLENYTYAFDYRGDTYTAAQAMEYKAGNCLSLAIMTTALARIVDIETGYQLVNATPVFKKQNNLLLLSHHVRTYLYDPNWQPKEGVLTLIRPRLIVDYFPSRYDVPGEAVENARFLSMYYRNLAADDLIAGNPGEAFWKAVRALELAPQDAENINLMAILYRRLGAVEMAEEFYRYGMNAAENNTNMLSNYALMLDDLQRSEEADNIRQRLLSFPDSNPYTWIKLGHEAYHDGAHGRAISYYKRAMALAPYLDEVYFGLAKSLYQRGEFTEAAKAMKKAAETSWEESERQLYYAKLSALSARNFDGD